MTSEGDIKMGARSMIETKRKQAIREMETNLWMEYCNSMKTFFTKHSNEEFKEETQSNNDGYYKIISGSKGSCWYENCLRTDDDRIAVEYWSSDESKIRYCIN